MTNNVRTIDVETLRSKRACQGQVDLFVQLFPAGTPVTRELCVEHASTFDWEWAAEKLLPELARAEYDRACKLARVEYDRVCELTLAEYSRVCELTLAEYSRVRELAQAEYDRSCELAWAECERACELAWVEYNRVRAVAFADAFNAD